MRPTLPDGPRRPSLLQLAAWMRRPTELLEACHRRYGDCFTLRLAGFPPIVILCDPALVKEVFTGEPDVLFAGPANAVLRPILGEHSLLILDGKRHHQERKLMMPAFHGERMLAYGEAMRAIARENVSRWARDSVFPLHAEMQHIALEVILRTVFGLEEGARKVALGEALRKMLAFGEHPSLLLLIDSQGQVRGRRLQERLGPLSPWGWFQRTLDRIDALLAEEIAARRARAWTGEDVLSMLLAARDESGAALSDQALRDEMKTLLVAGHETTATALTWTMLELLRHPAVLRRLRDELDAGREDYLDAVIKEAMRLRPIVPMVGRVLQAPLRVGGREYPAGTALIPSIYLAQRRAAAWPAPERFDPERFLGKRASPYEYFPFGGGARRCIGMAFALFEMRVVLREVARVPLELAPGYRPKMVRRGVTFAVSQGLPVVRRAQAAPRAVA